MQPTILLRLSLLSALLVSACTQAPAEVDMRGQNSYGRSASSGGKYNYNARYSARNAQNDYEPPPRRIVPQETNQAAPAGSIGVSDLSPPAPSAAPKPAEAKAADAKPIDNGPHTLGTVSKTSASASGTNPWTGKPHFSDNTEVKDLPPPEPAKPEVKAEVKQEAAATAAPVAKLDDMVANDGEKKTPKAEKASADSYIWPVGSKKIISPYGSKGAGKFNDGVNIASAEGEPVWAAADGEVVFAGNQLKGYGNMVLIKHAGGKTTTYAHLSKLSVDKYQRVKQGDVVGYVGTTGGVKEPQLHFAVRNGKDAVDPQTMVR